MACQIPQLPPNPYKPDVKKSGVPAPAGILHAQGAENALVMVALSSKHQAGTADAVCYRESQTANVSIKGISPL